MKKQIKYLLHKRYHVVYFDKKAVENYDKSQGGIILVRSNSRAEFSIEWGYVHETCEPEFFSRGDKVLIAYDVFRLGKYQHIAKGEKPRNMYGNDMYRAQKDEIVAKYITGPDGKETILPKPGWVLVEAPAVVSAERVSAGGIIIPQSVVAEERDRKNKKPSWVNVLYSNSDGINPKDVVLMQAWNFLPFDSIGMLAVWEEAIMAIKT